jgi:hypothetical protein
VIVRGGENARVVATVKAGSTRAVTRKKRRNASYQRRGCFFDTSSCSLRGFAYCALVRRRTESTIPGSRHATPCQSQVLPIETGLQGNDPIGPCRLSTALVTGYRVSANPTTTIPAAGTSLLPTRRRSGRDMGTTGGFADSPARPPDTKQPSDRGKHLERVRGIEPRFSAWETRTPRFRNACPAWVLPGRCPVRELLHLPSIDRETPRLTSVVGTL